METTPSSPNSDKPEVLTSEHSRSIIKATEAWLATGEVTYEMLLEKRAVLNEIFDLPLRIDVDMIGEGYIANEEGEELGEDIVASTGARYEGFSMIRPRGLLHYIVVLEFTDMIDANNPELFLTYYIPYDNLIKFVPEDDNTPYDGENEHLQRSLMAHSDRSEQILTSDEYKAMSSDEQRAELKRIASEVERDVMNMYGFDTVMLMSTEYSLITDKNQLTIITHIDQTSSDDSERTMIIGKVMGCNFQELLDTKTDTPLDTLRRPYPSIVIHDTDNDVDYFVPIRAFLYAHVIKASNQ